MLKSEETSPKELFDQLTKSYQDLVELSAANLVIYNDRDFQVYQAPTIHTLLQKIEQQYDPDLEKGQIKDRRQELKEIARQKEHITTNFYTQELVKSMESKQVKNESVNCAYLHAIQGLPSLKGQKERLKNSKLFSYRLSEELEFRPQKSIPPNVYQLYSLVQVASQSKLRFVTHISVFHPFSHKKTQEIIASQDCPIKKIMDEIDCPVQLTEMKFYQQEVQLFDPPGVNFGDPESEIGNVEFLLCKQYHFVHLNQCKHRIYIHEIRGLLENEPNEPFVRTIYKAPLKIKSCEGCGRSAELFRSQDSLINGNPVFLCRYCDEQLHANTKEENPLPYFCD